MLSSMTGFGRAVIDAPFGRLTVEIQSVNRKYLEVFVSLPKEYSRFEHEIRKQVNEKVSRGSISVRMFLHPNATAIGGFIPDQAVLKELKNGWENVAKQIGSDPKEITLSFLMNNLPSVSKQELAPDEDYPHLQRCINEALDALVKMKQTEGRAIFEDLLKRVNELETMLKTVETLSPEASLKMRQRLFEKMEEVLKGNAETEERLLREVALFSERVDITEEIIRFKSHIAQFREVLKGSVVGRKMDFLIQELGREVNTIGSKSMEARISHLVVDMKSELEKMREQIQNLE